VAAALPEAEGRAEARPAQPRPRPPEPPRPRRRPAAGRPAAGREHGRAAARLRLQAQDRPGLRARVRGLGIQQPLAVADDAQASARGNRGVGRDRRSRAEGREPVRMLATGGRPWRRRGRCGSVVPKTSRSSSGSPSPPARTTAIVEPRPAPVMPGRGATAPARGRASHQGPPDSRGREVASRPEGRHGREALAREAPVSSGGQRPRINIGACPDRSRAADGQQVGAVRRAARTRRPVADPHRASGDPRRVNAH
jgi:hypothetical protein